MNTPLNHDQTALAVVLENQRVGLAVLTREHLLSFAVVAVWRGGELEGRMEYLMRGIARRLRTFEVTHLAIVEPVMSLSSFAARVRVELEEIAEARGMAVSLYSRKELGGQGHGSNYRGLAFNIVSRHPELRTRVRLGYAMPGYRSVKRPHDTYNRPLFLAVAAAERALADALVPELPVQPTLPV